MPVNSPLSHITEVIQQVKASAQNYKTVLQNNEAATRATLIDPILRALGWDTSDARMVVFELTSGGFRVDYALRDAQSHVKAIVEAKAFGGNLDDTNIIGKLFNYAIHFKLSEIWLTDGVVWHHHANLNIKDYAPTKVLDLANDDAALIAAYFVASLDAAKYWPKEVTVDNVTQEVGKLRQQICEMQKSYEALEQRLAKLEAAPPKPVPTQTTTVPQLAPLTSIIATPRPTPGTFIDLATFAYKHGVKPKILRLPSGKQIPVSSWSDVLKECCEYVLSSNSSLSLPMADATSGKTKLISFNPPPSYIKRPKTFLYNGKTAYFYLNYDGPNIIKNTNHILSFLPSSNPAVSAAVLCK